MMALINQEGQERKKSDADMQKLGHYTPVYKDYVLVKDTAALYEDTDNMANVMNICIKSRYRGDNAIRLRYV